jgi:hypothetical protein
MSTQGAYGSGAYGSGQAGDVGASPGVRAKWSPVELVAMVLGFMMFWPIGLAVLGYKYWQSKMGGPDLQTVATGAFNNARSAVRGFQQGSGASWASSGAWATGSNWARGFTTATGNAAFDDWKSAELARLEAERRRLEDAHREFAEWVETVRKAKDREEFDRFMNERRARG